MLHELTFVAPAQPMAEYDNAARSAQQLVMSPNLFDTHRADVHHCRGRLSYHFTCRHRTPQTRKYAIGVVARVGEEIVIQDAQSGSNHRSWSDRQGGTRRIVMRQLLQFLHVLKRGAEKQFV